MSCRSEMNSSISSFFFFFFANFHYFVNHRNLFFCSSSKFWPKVAFSLSSLCLLIIDVEVWWELIFKISCLSKIEHLDFWHKSFLKELNNLSHLEMSKQEFVNPLSGSFNTVVFMALAKFLHFKFVLSKAFPKLLSSKSQQ